MRLKKHSPAGKRRARRRLSVLTWRRFVEREIRRLATPCPRCGLIEYWGCVKSCFQHGEWAYAWPVPYRVPPSAPKTQPAEMDESPW